MIDKMFVSLTGYWLEKMNILLELDELQQLKNLLVMNVIYCV